ncbi:hypothetical protein C0Q70_02306 [Pomacea canaliculata]|uniref:Uncharacterized protein n=1 Tax=Pomacea canaliculata TaxID=400727 RepID=A0A2T7PPJ6_POMCA|nr:hypothetical protein C0Q70_02306 [Pomacea canaliculata]
MMIDDDDVRHLKETIHSHFLAGSFLGPREEARFSLPRSTSGDASDKRCLTMVRHSRDPGADRTTATLARPRGRSTGRRGSLWGPYTAPRACLPRSSCLSNSDNDNRPPYVLTLRRRHQGR